jgi:hypothetical protein
MLGHEHIRVKIPTKHLASKSELLTSDLYQVSWMTERPESSKEGEAL